MPIHNDEMKILLYVMCTVKITQFLFFIFINFNYVELRKNTQSLGQTYQMFSALKVKQYTFFDLFSWIYILKNLTRLYFYNNIRKSEGVEIILL